MRICFTSDQANDLESVMSYHFGHCPYFVIVDVNNDGNIESVKSIANPLADEHNVGDLPSFMKSQNVNVIITGGMGPKAQQYFVDYSIKPVTGAYGKVKDVLEEYLQKKVTYAPRNEQTDENESGCDNEGESEENKEVDRLKKDVTALRAQIADLKSILKKIEDKLE